MAISNKQKLLSIDHLLNRIEQEGGPVEAASFIMTHLDDYDLADAVKADLKSSITRLIRATDQLDQIIGELEDTFYTETFGDDDDLVD